MSAHEFTAGFLFAGIGGGALGFAAAQARLGSAGAGFRIVGGVDFDPLACKDFEALVGAPAAQADIASMQPADLCAAWGNRAPDVVLMSPPCLPASGPVVTRGGVRPISSVSTGDFVLTHAGRYQRVAKVNRRMYFGAMVGVRLNGTVDTQEFTVEHPVWRRKVIRRNRKRCLGPVEFAQADSLRIGDRVGFPIDEEDIGTAQRFVDAYWGTGERANRRTVDLRPLALSPDLWFLLGAYVGDGYRRQSTNETIFCLGRRGGRKHRLVCETMTRMGLHFYESDEGGETNIKVFCSQKHLCALAGAFGDGAENKDIPPELMHLESALASALLDGYRATDGDTTPKRRGPTGSEHQAKWGIPSVSLPLLRSVQRLLLRFSVFGGIHIAWHGGPHVIEGRTVNTLPRWKLCVALDPKKRTAFEFGTHEGRRALLASKIGAMNLCGNEVWVESETHDA